MACTIEQRVNVLQVSCGDVRSAVEVRSRRQSRDFSHGGSGKFHRQFDIQISTHALDLARGAFNGILEMARCACRRVRT